MRGSCAPRPDNDRVLRLAYRQAARIAKVHHHEETSQCRVQIPQSRRLQQYAARGQIGFDIGLQALLNQVLRRKKLYRQKHGPSAKATKNVFVAIQVEKLRDGTSSSVWNLTSPTPSSRSTCKMNSRHDGVSFDPLGSFGTRVDKPRVQCDPRGGLKPSKGDVGPHRNFQQAMVAISEVEQPQ